MKDFRFLFEKYVLKQHLDPERKLKKQIVKVHGNLFVDVGSNQKVYANLVKWNFKKTVTVDPNPKWNADIQRALSWFDGAAMFYIGNNLGSADGLMLNPHIQGKDYDTELGFNVPVSTYDSLKLDADLVKIDVEGAEFDVLYGMREKLPKQIIVELHDERRKKELEAVLKNRKYKTHWIDKSHIWGTL